MNILFYYNKGISPTKGGVARITSTLCQLFEAHGHKAWLMGLRPAEGDDKSRQCYLPNPHKLDCEENRRAMADFCRDHGIDVVINQSGIDAEAARFISASARAAGVKSVACLHSQIVTPIRHWGVRNEHRLGGKGLGVLAKALSTPLGSKLAVKYFCAKNHKRYRGIIDKSDTVVVLTAGARDELLAAAGLADCGKIAVIPNCLDIPEPTGAERRDEVLWVGEANFTDKKLDYMLRIWRQAQAKMPGWRLRVIGDGPDLHEAKAMADALGLERVVFEGRIDASRSYAQAKVLCLTSANESFSLVTAEAMANGLAVMAFDSFPAARMLISDGVNGLLAKPFDLRSYADKLASLCADPAALAAYGAAGRERAKAYAPSAVYPLWQKVLTHD